MKYKKLYIDLMREYERQEEDYTEMLGGLVALVIFLIIVSIIQLI